MSLKKSVGLFAFVTLLTVLSACGGSPRQAGVDPLKAEAGTVRATLDTFSIMPSTDTVHSGPITFVATNQSALTHEMLVVRVKDLELPLADERVASTSTGSLETGEGEAEDKLVQQLYDEGYDRLTSRLVEDKINSLGEVADIAGGATGDVTLDLTPGEYLLLCNITAHYQAGMHARLVVLP